ncbi:putative non-specific lipid-transfer protein 14 [Tasmannia lanceolata]|uniref:putative non-specific lipid-transfer protein 14 n=1 Tax=Tasmannia lanceolata TaxID=3420 RepID=UPI0040649863
MGSGKGWAIGVVMMGVVMLLSCGASAISTVECSTVTSLISNCSDFVTHGSPDPAVGSPCCNAVLSLNKIGNTVDNRRSVCSCLMGLIATYNPNATAMATLPSLCGISLGFTIEPTTDCNT